MEMRGDLCLYLKLSFFKQSSVPIRNTLFEWKCCIVTVLINLSRVRFPEYFL